MTFTVYTMRDFDGEPLYVGCTRHLGARMASHERERSWFQGVASVDLERHSTRDAALARERELILALRPRHNARHLGRTRAYIQVPVAQRVRELEHANLEPYVLGLLDAGLSYRDIAKHLQELTGVPVSHPTIMRWAESWRREAVAA